LEKEKQQFKTTVKVLYDLRSGQDMAMPYILIPYNKSFAPGDQVDVIIKKSES